MRTNPHPVLTLTAPEKQPDSRAQLHDVTTAISWRSWTQGSEEALQRRLPMLVLAEPWWANSAQRIGFFLTHDDSLRAALESQVIPVLVDPDQHPDLVAAWRWVAVTLAGSAGPPLMMFLTHEGQPFLPYCTMKLEGDDRHPSLGSLVRTVSEEYSRAPARFIEEARELQSSTGVELAPENDLSDWQKLPLDMPLGGLMESAKHPHPRLLWAMLEAQENGTLPVGYEEWLSATLDSMARGGVYDQIDRGFHRCGRGGRWVLPHFEKPVPLNAQLAAIYARAASQFVNQQYRDIANHLIAFCTFALREDVDVIASDSDYYTWTAKEILNALDPALVQVISLHYDITPIPNRQGLHRALEVDAMDQYSYESLDLLRTRLVKGRAQLRMARQKRLSPPVLSMRAPSWRAETIRWLLEAQAWSKAVDVASVIAGLEKLLANRFCADRGYVRQQGDGGTSAWLEDQASLLASFLTAYIVTDEELWRHRAVELADIILVNYSRQEGWLEQPGGRIPSLAVVDGILPATLPTLNRALQELTAVTDDTRFADRAREAMTRQRSMETRSGYWSASMPY